MSNLFNFGITSSVRKKIEKSEKSSDNGCDSAKKNYESKKRKRSFLPAWQNDFEWVRYSEVEDAMFCKYCEKNDKSKTSNFVSGCQSFRIDSLKYHEKTSNHLEAVKKEQFETMKKHNKVAVCSYTGEIKTESTSNESKVLSGCSNVVGAMDLLLKKMNKDELKQLNVYFSSAYWVAKKELPFQIYPSLLDLQEVNGVKVMESYRNDKGCTR